MRIRISQIEKIIPIILLILTLNKYTSTLACLILLIYGLKNSNRTTKAIIYNFIFSQLNSSIFHNPGNIRVIINLILIFRIFLYKETYKTLKKSTVNILLVIYLIYIIISALYVSWLPFVSLFKAIYFVFGFLSLYVGVRISKDEKWIDWLGTYFANIVIANLFFLFSPIGYSANKTALNGIFANPNGLGITTVLATTIFIYLQFTNKRSSNYFYILIGIIEIFSSDSRTSILTLSIILIYVFFVKLTEIFYVDVKKIKKEILKFLIIIIGCLLIYNFYKPSISEFISEKILKGQETTEILVSREGQVESFEEDFIENKFFGVGFGVDGAKNREQNWSIKLSYPVERGNIVLAILAETGIVGMGLFLLILIALIKSSMQNNEIKYFRIKFIFVISVFMISMGEMTFFSANSLGVIQWFMLSIYSSAIRE